MKTRKGFTLIIILLVVCFNVNGQIEDTIPPVLNWITITPSVVNNNDTITVQMNVTDDVSGVDHVGAYLGSPTNSLYQNLNGAFNYIGNDTYETKIKIDNWAINGQWYISNLYLVDSAGINSSPNNIEYFTVNSSTPDSTAPILNWITITPNTVNNNDTIIVQMNVTDDVSGVDHVGAYLGSPTNSLYQNLNGAFNYIGNDTYETKVAINNWAVSGQWYISNFYLVDSASNNFSPNNIEYFTVNSSTPDSVAPTLNWITVIPDTVYNNDTIAIQINVTDDVSGVDHVGSYLGSPDNSLYQNLNGAFSYIGNDTYETKVQINNWAVSGEWYISNFYLVDSAGNNSSPNNIEYFIVINTNSSVFELKAQTSFSIYPNPTIGKIFMLDSKLLGNYVLSVFSQNGQIIFNNTNNRNECIFDFSEYPKGLYLLRFVTENNLIIVEKVLVE